MYNKWREGYVLPTWARKITSQSFDWMLQSSSGQKWKTCEQTLLFIAMHYWGCTSLEVKERSVRIAPPSLPSDHSGPAEVPWSVEPYGRKLLVCPSYHPPTHPSLLQSFPPFLPLLPSSSIHPSMHPSICSYVCVQQLHSIMKHSVNKLNTQ